MKAFAALYAALDASTSTRHKVAVMSAYLRSAPPADAAWAVYFLAGGKPRQTVPARVLREAACEAAGLAPWLFEESYAAVGDLAETIAHLLPEGAATDDTGLAQWLQTRLLPLRGAAPEDAARGLREAWAGLDWNGRFLLNKLITGGLRVGVSRQLVVRALAAVSGLDAALIAQRMIGFTDARRSPEAQHLAALLAPPQTGVTVRDGRPYPFFLAHPLAGAPDTLGDIAGWQVEWKWDGVRGQLVLRDGQVWLWSRGEELVTERFPEVVRAAQAWAARHPAQAAAGTVFDGELLAWDSAAARPMPFAALQRRIARLKPGPALLREVPVRFLAYDLLEDEGRDWRERPLAERRARLEELLGEAVASEAASEPSGHGQHGQHGQQGQQGQQGQHGQHGQQGEPVDPPGALPRLQCSPRLSAPDWPSLAALRASARTRGVEGLMLKHRDGAYGVGRLRVPGGGWWKWKLDPLSIDAVLLYAQRGHGRRASLYTDYTFAVWAEPPGEGEPPALVPFAKAYSGLTDEEIRQVDAVIRRTTVERFGPLRSLQPTLVFELGFEGIAPSPRHRSGVAVRFPRMLRWRTDKPIREADTLDSLRALLAGARDDPDPQGPHR
jgi:DNA ligase-1